MGGAAERGAVVSGQEGEVRRFEVNAPPLRDVPDEAAGRSKLIVRVRPGVVLLVGGGNALERNVPGEVVGEEGVRERFLVALAASLSRSLPVGNSLPCCARVAPAHSLVGRVGLGSELCSVSNHVENLIRHRVTPRTTRVVG